MNVPWSLAVVAALVTAALIGLAVVFRDAMERERHPAPCTRAWSRARHPSTQAPKSWHDTNRVWTDDRRCWIDISAPTTTNQKKGGDR